MPSNYDEDLLSWSECGANCAKAVGSIPVWAIH